MDFDAVVKSLEALSPFYAEAVGAFSDEELRSELTLFGPNLRTPMLANRRC